MYRCRSNIWCSMWNMGWNIGMRIHYHRISAINWVFHSTTKFLTVSKRLDNVIQAIFQMYNWFYSINLENQSQLPRQQLMRLWEPKNLPVKKNEWQSDYRRLLLIVMMLINLVYQVIRNKLACFCTSDMAWILAKIF